MPSLYMSFRGGQTFHQSLRTIMNGNLPLLPSASSLTYRPFITSIITAVVALPLVRNIEILYTRFKSYSTVLINLPLQGLLNFPCRWSIYNTNTVTETQFNTCTESYYCIILSCPAPRTYAERLPFSIPTSTHIFHQSPLHFVATSWLQPRLKNTNIEILPWASNNKLPLTRFTPLTTKQT